MARVLVIDDNSTLRFLIAATLEKAGHGVMQVAHGRDGAALVKQETVDLLITDLVMPDDSLDHVLALHAEHPRLPVILISGLISTSPRMKAAAETLQARRTLPKPFKAPELIAAAEAVLAEEAARGESGRQA